MVFVLLPQKYYLLQKNVYIYELLIICKIRELQFYIRRSGERGVGGLWLYLKTIFWLMTYWEQKYSCLNGDYLFI